jgi:hypothetical protein
MFTKVGKRFCGEHSHLLEENQGKFPLNFFEQFYNREREVFVHSSLIETESNHSSINQ